MPGEFVRWHFQQNTLRMTGLQRSILLGLQILVLLIALDGGVAYTSKRPTTTKRLTTTTPKKTTTTCTKKTTTGKTTTTTTQPTTTPNPLQCASLDFKNLQTKCCSSPAKDLLASSYNKTIEDTCQTPGVDNSVFNVFALNDLLNSLKSDIVNLNDIYNFAVQFNQSACYILCYVLQIGTAQSIGPIPALTALLIANQDPAGPWDEIISAAVSECVTVILKLPLQILPSALRVCQPVVGLVVQCVLATIVDKCPSRVTSASCNSDYALYDQCKQLTMTTNATTGA